MIDGWLTNKEISRQPTTVTVTTLSGCRGLDKCAHTWGVCSWISNRTHIWKCFLILLQCFTKMCFCLPYSFLLDFFQRQCDMEDADDLHKVSTAGGAPIVMLSQSATQQNALHRKHAACGRVVLALCILSGRKIFADWHNRLRYLRRSLQIFLRYAFMIATRTSELSVTTLMS